MDDLNVSCKNNCTLKARAKVSGEGMLLFAGRAMLQHSKENHSKDPGLLQGYIRGTHWGTSCVFKPKPDLYS